MTTVGAVNSAVDSSGVSISGTIASVAGVAASALHSASQIEEAGEDPELEDGSALQPPADILGRAYTQLEVIDLSLKHGKSNVMTAIDRCKSVFPKSRTLAKFFLQGDEKY